MSTYAEYAERVSERYGLLQGVDQATTTWEAGYVPLQALRGPDFAEQEWSKHKQSLDEARRRVNQQQITDLLEVGPEVELLWKVPFGTPTSIADVVRREPRVVLVSAAGGGKTTALRYLAANRPVSRVVGSAEGKVQQEPYVPVMVDLALLADQTLPQFLAEDAQRRLSLSLTPDFFEELLSGGKALLCLDGLDEISNQDARAKMVRRIEGWARDYAQCRYVVTTRANVYEPALDAGLFAHYVLMPWSDSVVSEVESAWNKALDEWTVAEPNRAYYAGRSRLWQHLALAMRYENRRSVSLAEAQEWLVDEALNDKKLRLNKRTAPTEVAALLGESVPHLPMVRIEGDQLSFAPRLLHDILAARALATWCIESSVRDIWDDMQGYLWTGTWSETLSLATRFLAQDEPKLWSRLAGLVLEAGQQDPLEPVLHRHLLLAASALGDPSYELDRATRRRVIDGLLDWMSDPNAVGRYDAVSVLLRLGGEPYAIEQVLEKAKDNALDAWTREAAILLLGTMGSSRPDEAVRELQSIVDKADEPERLHVAAAAALGVLSSGGALEGKAQSAIETWLVGHVQNPEVPIGMRTVLAATLSQALRKTHSATVLNTFIGLARSENEGEEQVPYSVRIAAARGVSLVLPELDDRSVVERLWELARDDQVDDAVRTILAEGLGKVDDVAEATRVLLGVARSPAVYPPGHRSALEAVGRLGYAGQAVIDELSQIATSTDRAVKDFVRLAACITLGDVGQIPLSIQNLLMLVADKSIYRTTRNDALAYLARKGRTGDADLDDAVISVLQIWLIEENTTEDVKENAMQSLVMLKAQREDVLKDIIGVIQDKRTYPRVRRTVAEMLFSLPTEEKATIAEALSPTFYDTEETSDLLRVPLARILYSWSDDENALTYLKAAAEKSYMALVRYKAAIALGEIGEMELATATLLKLVQDPEIADPIRCDSLRTLSMWTVGNKEMAEAISMIAQNTELEPNVRQAAGSALRSIVSV